MTLEDFFTLTEMKSGLVTPSRVEELISVMQQQKDCATNNLSDTARQWSSVARMLAATENKDCLTHFVKANGLSYLSQWLQEALKFNNDVADFAVEELLNALLGSLERLPITKEDSVASGIQFVVEQLVGSKSTDIKERARTLSERWKHVVEKDVSYQFMNKDEKCKGDNLKSSGDLCAVDSANLVPSPQVVDISTCREEPEASNAREKSEGCIHTSRSDILSDLLTSTVNKSTPANAKSEDMNTVPSSLVPNSCREDLSGTCSNDSEDVAADYHDASVRKEDVLDMKMDVDKNEGHTSESGQRESSKIPPASSLLSVSSLAHKPERSASCNFDAKEIKPHKSDTIDTLSRSASIDCVIPTYLRNVDLKPDMQDILTNGSNLRNKDDLETSPDEKGEIGSPGEVRLDAVASLNSSKAINRKSIVGMDESTELGLEYGDIDALEVARLVAIEVEREVVDYREPFCSSSPDCNSSEEMGPQFSEDHKDGTANVEQIGKDHGDASSHKDGNKMISESEADKGPDKREQDVEVLMDKTNQNRCIFDLNEDVCVEESPDCWINSAPNKAINISAPIAVAASKGASFLPVSPLRFEGELGWRGSAATSAFRPASPRKTPEVEKTSSGHKRKANLIEIDLNVADSGVDPLHPVSVKSVPQEDSAEVSSRRADRLKLDLNRAEEEDMPPLVIPSSCWSLPHLNGNQTMSPVSSSSSRQQPTLRNFDLNDNPSFFDSMGSIKHKNISSRSENSGFTIMGSKITERMDNPNGAPQSLMGSGHAIMPYGHFPLHAYGYNGHMMGASVSFPPPLYGHGNIPYMVDSQGATVVPQILSSASSAIPPFLMSAPNSSVGLNGSGTSQSGLDLISTEDRNFKNFFLQGRNGLTEDQARVASESGGSANRREADSGWEPYNFVASWR